MKNLPAHKTLTTYVGERRVFTLGNEALVSVIRPHTCGKARMLVAVSADGYRTAYPFVTVSGKIDWNVSFFLSKRFLERSARHIRAAGLE